MTRQTTITVSGGVGESVRQLVAEFPGANANRVGRALVRLGLKEARKHRSLLVEELRVIDSPWSPLQEADGDE
jgi:hypothetical protein